MELIQEESAMSALVVHLDPALRAEMEAYSEKAGESLDAFISEASTLLLERRKAEEWYARARHSTPEGRAWAIALLNRPSDNPPMRGDELPEGYIPSERRL